MKGASWELQLFGVAWCSLVCSRRSGDRGFELPASSVERRGALLCVSCIITSSRRRSQGAEGGGVGMMQKMKWYTTYLYHEAKQNAAIVSDTELMNPVRCLCYKLNNMKNEKRCENAHNDTKV